MAKDYNNFSKDVQMAKKYTKRDPTSQIISKMQITATMR